MSSFIEQLLFNWHLIIYKGKFNISVSVKWREWLKHNSSMDAGLMVARRAISECSLFQRCMQLQPKEKRLLKSQISFPQRPSHPPTFLKSVKSDPLALSLLIQGSQNTLSAFILTQTNGQGSIVVPIILRCSSLYHQRPWQYSHWLLQFRTKA